MPGSGGTARLVKAMGKSKAMEYILSCNTFDAIEAEKSGLVSKIFPPEKLVEEAIKLGNKIASYSQPAVIMAKECIN